MDRDVIHKLRETLCHQLKDYAEIQNFGGKALEDISNMVRTIKNLDIIESNDEDKTSRGGYYMGSYDDGASTRRGRGAMGRYVSRDDGLQKEMDAMREQLQAMMDTLDTLR